MHYLTETFQEIRVFFLSWLFKHIQIGGSNFILEESFLFFYVESVIPAEDVATLIFEFLVLVYTNALLLNFPRQI